MCTRKVLKNIPHSHHRPVILEYGLQIPLVRSIPKPRWKFKLADWKAFATSLDHIVQYIPPSSSNYNRFLGSVKAAAKRHTPREFRKTYIPAWDEHCSEQEEFQGTSDRNIAGNLIKALNENRRNKWHETTANLNFTNSSRKAWDLVRKLGFPSLGIT